MYIVDNVHGPYKMTLNICDLNFNKFLKFKLQLQRV